VGQWVQEAVPSSPAARPLRYLDTVDTRGEREQEQGEGNPETPLRALRLEVADGCHLLSEPSLTYRDGGEDRVLELLTQAKDLSSTSDELLAKAAKWSERYHLDPGRAHVLRPLRLEPSWAVLEIGAGCGAITRFLGESCGPVDAVEPTKQRAICARQRTRDLPNVEVFVGALEDVPPVAAYDVVVIMGVLEYVGGGSADSDIYLDFLRRAATLIRAGGSLVLGIENRLGVKYLCGAPEDHSGRPFESVEGYDQSSSARTFSRHDLESFVSELGLTPKTLGLFPDYKITRLVFADSLLEFEPQLAIQIPHFPSPDWAGGRHRVANEARVWANLVNSGLGRDTANSFLLLAHQGQGPSPLWDEDVLAVYYAGAGRRMAYSAETTVVRPADVTAMSRRPLVADAPVGAAVRLFVQSGVLAEGEDLVRRMAHTSSDEELALLLKAWTDELDRVLEEGSLPAMDLLPHNAIITPTGTITFIDAKWELAGFQRSDILARAAFQTAWRLAGFTSPSRWPAITLEALALHIGALLDIAPETGWLAGTLDKEAHFQAQVSVGGPDDRTNEDEIRHMRAALEDQLAQPLAVLASARPFDLSPVLERLYAELGRASSLILSEESRAAAGEARAAAEEARAAAEEARAAAEADRANAAEEWARSLVARLAEAEAHHSAAESARVALRDELDRLYATRILRWSKVPRSAYGRLWHRRQ